MGRELQVFLAHSFADEDRGVVAYYKRFLEQYRSQGLRWVSAEAGEAGSLNAKIRRLINESGVFVGILTRRHFLIDRTSSFRGEGRPLGLILRGLWHDPSWATTGWTLQESGYAIGRDRTVILLVEAGVQDLAGLQGDIVRIDFRRNALGESLQELAGQLNSVLTPPPSVAPEVVAEAPGPPEVDPGRTGVPVIAAEGPGEATPSSWSEFFRAAYARDFDLVDAERKAQAAIAEAQEEEKQQLIEVELLDAIGRSGGEAGLRWLLARDSVNGSRSTASAIAVYWHERKEPERELEWYGKCLERASANKFDLSDARISAAMSRALVVLERGDEAGRLLINALGKATDDESRVVLAEALASTARATGESDDELAWLEYALSRSPDNDDLRFKAGRVASALRRQHQCLVHYSMLAGKGERPAATNNLGVACEAVGLQGKAIEAYKLAAKLGETLAMANRAELLIKAGCHAEADDVISEGESQKDHHANIGNARARLRDAVEGEEKKLAELLEEGGRQRRFFAAFAEAKLLHVGWTDTSASVWLTPFGRVPVLRNGAELAGEETEEATAAALGEFATGVFGLSFGRAQASRVKRTVTVKGRITGSAGRATVTKAVLWIESLIPGPAVEKKEILFFVDGNGLRVMEEPDASDRRAIVRYEYGQ